MEMVYLLVNRLKSRIISQVRLMIKACSGAILLELQQQSRYSVWRTYGLAVGEELLAVS